MSVASVDLGGHVDHPCARKPEAQRPRRAGPQPEERRPRDPARFARRVHRTLGLGQVEPRVRHDLRRGPAPLRRVAVGVRAPVPRAGRPSRRRLHRGSQPRGVASTRSPRTATRARRSARSPRSTTTCACSGRASASRTAPVCGEKIQRQTVQQIADQLMELETGTRYQVLAPVISQKKGEFVDLFKELAASGYSRALVDGEVIQLTEPPILKKQIQARHLRRRRPPRRRRRPAHPPHRLGRDRARPQPGSRARSTSSTSRAPPACAPSARSSAARTATRSQLTEIEPRTFSFNAPFGACPECSGLGTQDGGGRRPADRRRRASRSTRASSCPWNQAGKGMYSYFQRLLEGLVARPGLRPRHPVGQAVRRGAAGDPARQRLRGAGVSGATATAAR